MSQSLLDRQQELVECVGANDFVLNEASYRAVCEVLQVWAGQREVRDALLRLAPEFTRTEFFANVTPLSAGGDCTVVMVSDAVLSDFARLRTALPGAAHWFQPLECGEGVTLGVNRWLAHFAGFRHRVVHLFLDPPTGNEYTYVQLRSFDKINAPGCFDVAVGGHVKGLDSLDDTVRNELAEELHLDRKQWVASLERTGCYDFEGHDTDGEFVNVESRSVYRARLVAGALDQVRFEDGEAAALCLFSRAELNSLMRDYPERLASGLRESYRCYVRQTDAV